MSTRYLEKYLFLACRQPSLMSSCSPLSIYICDLILSSCKDTCHTGSWSNIMTSMQFNYYFDNCLQVSSHFEVLGVKILLYVYWEGYSLAHNTSIVLQNYFSLVIIFILLERYFLMCFECKKAI
jgi:hypothetical protein